MSLIVETGTGSATSEAYASVAFCDTYFTNQGKTLWATLALGDKEAALRRAASFMTQAYRLRWKGYRYHATQALDWPRYDVSVPDLGVLNVINPDVIPDLVIIANAELALLAAAGDLNPPQNQNILSKQVGPLKIVYDSNSPQGTKYLAVDDILRPLFATGTGVNYKLRRV